MIFFLSACESSSNVCRFEPDIAKWKLVSKVSEDIKKDAFYFNTWFWDGDEKYLACDTAFFSNTCGGNYTVYKKTPEKNFIVAKDIICISRVHNKLLNKDKKQFAVFVPQHFSKPFFAC
jgi:hypothetical protein